MKCRLLRRVLAVRWWACAAQVSHSRPRAEGAVAKHAATRLSNGTVAVDTYDNMFEVELFACLLFRSSANSGCCLVILISLLSSFCVSFGSGCCLL